MKAKPFKFHCGCNTDLKFYVGKPTAFTPTVALHNCPNCETKYLFRASKDKKDHKFKVTARILKCSEKLKTIMSNKLIQRENENGTKNS